MKAKIERSLVSAANKAEIVKNLQQLVPPGSLDKIIQSGQEIPIYFQGLIPDHEELFFLGQVDWYNPTGIHLLINALEEKFTIIVSFRDMSISEIVSFNLGTLNRYL